MKQYREYIDIDPQVLAGKPVIKGTRISVSLILNFLANGHTVGDIRKEYPFLTKEQIHAAILFAARRLDSEEEFPYA